MSCYSKKNIEKKQWYVTLYEPVYSARREYLITTSDRNVVNDNPMCLDEAMKFRSILNKLKGYKHGL